MPQHPEPHIRRAVRVLAAVGELHKRGYQRLRVMPFMSPSGSHWRCWIGPGKFFYRNHGAILGEETAVGPDEEVQERATVARYTSGQENQYFGWKDAQRDDVRSLTDKFLAHIRFVADGGQGWDKTEAPEELIGERPDIIDRKSTRLNSSHQIISYAVFCC